MDSFGHKKPINGQTLVKLLAIIDRRLAESFPSPQPVLLGMGAKKGSCRNGTNLSDFYVVFLDRPFRARYL